MIRFILKTKYKSKISGLEYEQFHTLDVDCPELERCINVGGEGEGSFHFVQVVGAERIEK